MSMAIAHVAFGAAMTTLAVAAVRPRVGYPGTLAVAGGVWAILPDLHWISPVAPRQLHRVHQTSPWVDLFWAHRTLDDVDPTDSKSVAALFVGLLLVATLFAEWRSNRATPPGRASTPRLGDRSGGSRTRE